MGIFEKFRARLRGESFQPTLLSAIFNPAYIIRRGLYRAIKDLAPSISGNVLDFGCGSKPYESLFTGAAGYLGVDLEVTGHNHSDSKIDVFYDGKVLPFQNGQFEAVVAFEVFEHVFNLPEVLQEISRVTRSSGYLMISIPFAWNEHEVPFDFARYTSFGISHILKNAGYEIIELRKTTTYLLAVFQMFIAYLTQVEPPFLILRYLRQVFVIFPCTVTAYAVSSLLPKRYEYYCNIVLVARKLASQPTDV